MIGRGTLLWLALAIVAGIGLFQVSYRVQSLEEELTRVNREILQQRETIQVFRAEWSYLNEPTRLADLAQRHLNLAPLAASQMVRIEDLPLRMPPLMAETAPVPESGAAPQPAAASAGAPAPAPASIADLIKRVSEAR